MDEPTKFRVDCPCGDYVLVSEGAAGATFPCSCGKPIQIPSSIQLRLNAGLAPIVPPEEAVEQMLLAGGVPGEQKCSFCGDPTQEIIQVLATCERQQTKVSGGFSWGIFLFSLILLPVRIFLSEPRQEQHFGRDKIYRLPMYVCAKCRPGVRGPDAIKHCMRRVLEYRNLLEKFPNATVDLTG